VKHAEDKKNLIKTLISKAHFVGQHYLMIYHLTLSSLELTKYAEMGKSGSSNLQYTDSHQRAVADQ
jgi:hypothetical protein